MPIGIQRMEDIRASGDNMMTPEWAEEILGNYIAKIPLIGPTITTALKQAGSYAASALTGSLQNHFLFLVVNQTQEDLHLAWNTMMRGKCCDKMDDVIPKGAIAHWLVCKIPGGAPGCDMILVYKGAGSGVFHGFRAANRLGEEKIGMLCATSMDIEQVKSKLILDWPDEEGGRDNMQIRYKSGGKYVYIVARNFPNSEEATRYCYFNCVRSNHGASIEGEQTQLSFLINDILIATKLLPLS